MWSFQRGSRRLGRGHSRLLTTACHHYPPICQIGEEVFDCCSRLTNVELPEGLERIGKGACSYCHSLQTIVILATPGSIVARAAHNATLDNAFAINTTIYEVQYEDDADTETKNGDDDADSKVEGNGNGEDDVDGGNDVDGANSKVNVDGIDNDEYEEEGNENNSDDEDDDYEFTRAICLMTTMMI